MRYRNDDDRELIWVRLKLTEWGRKCRALGIGYPTMSATEKARIGRGGAFNGPSLPPDLAEIDHGVAVAPPQHKLMLVEVYTKGGDWRAKAAHLRLERNAFYRRKIKAETALKLWLESRTA